MPDTIVHNDPFGRDVMVQAFLYANGELEGTEALSFERRLGEDQAARDALCQAVLLCQPLGSQLAAPNPVYREQVRQRLYAGPQNAQSVSKSCLKTGHPALWGILGAVAAALLTLGLQKAYFVGGWGHGPGANMPGNGRSDTMDNSGGQNPQSGLNQAPSAGQDLLPTERSRTADEKEARPKTRAEDSRRQSTPPGQRPRPPAHHALTN
jgi:hypothetical protein